MDRKYRQHGYQDKDWEDRRKSKRPAQKKERLPDAPKGHRHAVNREAQQVVRCGACGHQIKAFMSIGAKDRCAGCGADLHTCRNCAHFESRSRFQCRKPVPVAVLDKTKRNDCELFRGRQVLDSTGRRADTAPRNARSAFDALFKKK